MIDVRSKCVQLPQYLVISLVVHVRKDNEFEEVHPKLLESEPQRVPATSRGTFIRTFANEPAQHSPSMED